jgi:hypothetical protein
MAVIAAGGLAARLWLGPHTADDAYIAFRYARNLAEGAGFAYNPGEPVLGASSPLHVLLLAAAARLGADLPSAAFGLSLLADAGSIVLLASLLARLGHPVASLVAAGLFALMPRALAAGVSGMETSLYVLAVLAAFAFQARERRAAAAAAAGLAALLRPDGLLVAVVLLAGALARRRLPLLEAAIVAAIVLPWVATATWLFGGALPQSVVAKALNARGAIDSARAAAEYFGGAPSALAISVAAVAGGSRLVSIVALRPWVAWAGAYLVLFVSAGAFGDYPWYFAPLLPPWFAAAGLGVEDLGERMRRAVAARTPARPARAVHGRRAAGARAWLAPLAIGVALAVAAPLAAQRHERTLRAWSSGREDLYRRVAIEIAATSPGALVAAPEIGTIGYFHRGPVLDLVGLVSPEAAGRPQASTVGARRPQWIVGYDTHLDRALLDAGWFRRAYALRQRIPVGPGRALLVFERAPAASDEERSATGLR